MSSPPTVRLLRLRGYPLLQQLWLEEALFRAHPDNWFVINDGVAAATVVLGISGWVQSAGWGPPPPPPLEGAAPPTEPEPSIKAQVLVMWGNVLYDHSQARVRAKRADWQAPLDEAVEKFNAAGCSQADITQALAVHASKA